MHEMSLCMSLLDLIAAEAEARGFTRVRKVVLEVGALSHVDPQAMHFGFEVSAQGTVAEGASLTWLSVPGQAWCVDCTQTVALAQRGDACPHCGSHKLMITAGEELRLKELEVS